MSVISTDESYLSVQGTIINRIALTERLKVDGSIRLLITDTLITDY